MEKLEHVSTYEIVVAIGCFIAAASVYWIATRQRLQAKKQLSVALDAREYREFFVLSNEKVAHNAIRMRLALPSFIKRLGLPVGQHVLVQARDENGNVYSRPYTPVTPDEDGIHHFDLVVKVYAKGKMSQYLAALQPNQVLSVRGPLGKLQYTGRGCLQIRGRADEHNVRMIGLLAGGSGITPCLQVMQAIARDVCLD